MTSLFPTIRLLFGPWRASERQQRALLRLIACSTEHRLDLPPLLEASAREAWGGQSRRLVRFAELLRGGTPLADAVERVSGLLNDERTLLVRFGALSGKLAPMVRRELAEPFPDVDTAVSWRRLVSYLLVFVLGFSPVALLLQVKILPSLEFIYEDFEIDTPLVWRWASGAMDLAVYAWIAAALSLLLMFWSRYFRWPANAWRRSVAPRLSAPVREGRVASLLQRLGDAAAAGRPMPAAISTLARYHYDPALRHKLLYARNELELGGQLWPALAEAGVLSADESTALSASDRTDTRAWTLSALSGARRARGEWLGRRRLGVLFPLVVLGIGLFVLVVSLSVFSALVNLIDALT